MKEIEIRAAEPGIGPAFVELFNKYYKRKTNVEYFKWQFFDSPFESRLFAAFDKDRLAGYYGVKLYPLTTGNLTGFVIDCLIDEVYRRRGIGALLEASIEAFCRDRKAVALSSLPNASGNAAFTACGWTSIAKIDTLVFGDPGHAKTISGASHGGYSSLEYIGFEKSSEFRRWRYDEHPIYRYGHVAVDEENFAYMKLYSSPFDGEQYLDIVELHSTEAGNVTRLLEMIFERGKELNVRTITVWALPHTALFQLLSQLGFSALHQERYFCLKALDAKARELYDIRNWTLNEIDAEIF